MLITVFTVLKSPRRRKARVELRHFFFSAIIRNAFGNEVSLTPKLILSLERATCSLFSKRVIYRFRQA